MNDALYHLKKDAYADERDWVFQLRAARARPAGILALAGETLTQAQLDAAVTAVSKATEPAHPVDVSAVRVLLTPETPWALVNRGVTDLYEAPTIHSDRLSQGLMGEAVRILETRGEWARVRMQRDGYMGWGQSAALFACDEAAVNAYLAACHHRVQAELLPTWAEHRGAGDPSEACDKLPFGCLAAVEGNDGEFARLRLPDGHTWWVQQEGLLARPEWPQPDPAGIESVLRLARRFAGTPYLWGGRTPFGYDCSGLTGAIWEFLGVPLPRDADQQRLAGQLVAGEPQPGDLLFFGRESPLEIETRKDSVGHVVAALGGGRFLHASGGAWGVTINSLNPEHSDFSPTLRARFIDARRYTHQRS